MTPLAIHIVDRHANISLQPTLRYRAPERAATVLVSDRRHGALAYATHTSAQRPDGVWALWPTGGGAYAVREVVPLAPTVTIDPLGPQDLAALAAQDLAATLRLQEPFARGAVSTEDYLLAYEVAAAWGYSGPLMGVGADFVTAHHDNPQEIAAVADDPGDLRRVARMILGGGDTYDVDKPLAAYDLPAPAPAPTSGRATLMLTLTRPRAEGPSAFVDPDVTQVSWRRERDDGEGPYAISGPTRLLQGVLERASGAGAVATSWWRPGP